MSPVTVGILGMVVFILALLFGLHIAVAMGLVGLIGLALITGPSAALGALLYRPYFEVSNYDYLVIPLFILMGEFAFSGGLTTPLFDTGNRWFGRLPGGLAVATTAAAAAFAANTGSSMASCVTIGKVALPEMKRLGYDDRLATGTVAAGGCLGVMIPPSILSVLYAIITRVSVGKVLVAGLLPGLMQAALFGSLVIGMAIKWPHLAPRGEPSTWKQRLVSLKDAWGTLLLALVIIGGIYSGLSTATEAAALGSLGAFLIGLFRRALPWSGFWSALAETTKMSVMIFAILIGTSFFVAFMAVSQIPTTISNMAALMPSPTLLIISVSIVYLILGCFMSAFAMMLLTLPILLPAVVGAGIDLIWFGIIIIILSEIGQLTPPFGLNVYALKGICPDVPIWDIFKGVMPFVLAELASLVLIMAFPQIGLWLPAHMG